MSSATAKKLHFLIATFLHFIIGADMVIERPIVKNKEMDIWVPNEVKRALPIMRADNMDMLELCVHISYACSARKGEVAALTWDNIDPVECVVRIEKQLQRLTLDAIEKTRNKPFYIFPQEKEGSKSVLAYTRVKMMGAIEQ